MTDHQQEVVNQLGELINVTINRCTMTQSNKEAYLNHAWQIITKYIRECKNES